MKWESNKTRLTRYKPGGGMPRLEDSVLERYCSGSRRWESKQPWRRGLLTCKKSWKWLIIITWEVGFLPLKGCWDQHPNQSASTAIHTTAKKISGSHSTEGKLLQTSSQREAETILWTGMLQWMAFNSSGGISKEGEEMRSPVY